MAENGDSRSEKKLQIVPTLRKTLATLAIDPPKPFEHFQYLYPQNWALLVGLMLAFISILFFLFHEARTIAEYSNSVYACAAMEVSSCVYVTFIWKRTHIFNFIESFEKIIEKRSEKPATKILYENTLKMIEKWTLFGHLFMIKISPISVLIPNLIVVTHAYFTQESLENDIYRMPYPAWFPFNWRSFPIGYLSAFCVEYIILYYVCSIVLCGMLIYTGSCLILMTITKDVAQEIRSINQHLISKSKRNKHMKDFYEIIQFHVETKQIFNVLSEIYKFVAIALFTYSLLSTCGTLLILQTELTKGTINLDVIDGVVKSEYAFGALYLFCELGERVRKHFENIENEIQNLDWHSFPFRAQRMLPTIILFAQQPAQIMAYGNIEVNRDSFKEIVNAEFSYFMIFRKF